ncbi:hypothetical protein M407DRAFT_241053 [Tulasnella calospora MUT 4182]|uniref:Uncharacterized protein n=1 Tax=Tulasnella calospora MUT 4182 TaxID=1051891 RepID=A0A0C3QV80_9AGAM|nr:hypothetical protein M407DRAFT_241053 [Tulasnella calospora MUT 4182]
MFEGELGKKSEQKWKLVWTGAASSKYSQHVSGELRERKYEKPTRRHGISRAFQLRRERGPPCPSNFQNPDELRMRGISGSRGTEL